MTQIGVVIFLYFTIFIVCCGSSANLHVADTFIVDDTGRIRLYHGVNFVMKGFPWYPPELTNAEYISNLSQTGINMIRLGMMWAGVEPEPKKYNLTYLNVMSDIIQSLAAKQIYVLLDMHQDVLSSQTGSYDGIPLWLYNRFPTSKHPYPWPFKTPPSGGNWGLGYLSEACSFAFQCFYDNIGGGIEAMGDFWKLVAVTYQNHSNILGYELINEPWAGNVFAHPTLLLPGNAGSKNLQPTYDKVANAIRSVDANTLIFYEPVTWGVRLNGKYSGSGFSHVPGGDEYRNRSVFSYHYYCTFIAIDPVPGNSTIPSFDRIVCDDVEGPALLRSVQKDVSQLGGSSFMTEFGGCEGSPTCDEQLEWGMSGSDQFLQSWSFWGNSYGDIKTLKRLARIYAQAIAGKPISMQYIADQRSFSLSYYVDTNIKQPTEIIIPPLQFPQNGYNVTVNNVLKWQIDSMSPNIILVEPSDQIINHTNQSIIGVIQIRPTTLF